MTAEARGLALDAPAKVNLYLHVLGRRPDGYHRLDSLVVFVDLADRLVARPADRLHLTITGPGRAALRAEPDNLVLRAARLLAAEAGVPARARIALAKRIPVAAGLGGGSADAAAALRLLDRLWRVRAAPEDLARLGARLGADVPVCLAGRPSLLRGIGERLDPAAPPPAAAALVLVNPRRPLATARVFAACAARPRRAAPAMGARADTATFARALARRRNDLTGAAAGLEPAIPAMLAELVVAGARLARMSGSGATCFGLFDDLDAAGRAVAWLTSRGLPWWSRAVAIRRDAPSIKLVA